ncbi:hypothetical protein [Butyrivibrio sp. FCS014]|nr:hypothetical protein [Butyrivibrio sp. FCS014]
MLTTTFLPLVSVFVEPAKVLFLNTPLSTTVSSLLLEQSRLLQPASQSST